jgi:aminoglycoside phosphotransferase (APT) family kinase protein
VAADTIPEQLIARVAGEAVSGALARVERVRDGRSTLVYRVASECGTWYLRVLPDPAETFAPEVAAHARLRELGVRVPAVTFFAERHPLLGRSAMVVEALAGAALFQEALADRGAVERVVTEAGRDLARLNDLAVNGFGRVQRSQGAGQQLHAPLASYREATMRAWDANVAALARDALSAAEVDALRRAISRYDAWLECPQARLTHGDCSVRHIFAHHGAYSGIIDLSDMRGDGHWGDLAYFHLRDGARLPYRLLPALLRGYAEVAPLPPDAEGRIRFASLLRNVATLPDALARRPGEPLTRHQLGRLREDLAAL